MPPQSRLPAGDGEPVVVVPYDPRWPALARAEAARLRRALGPALRAVHHVGSTAVPGLAAKPVLDLLLEVRPVPLEPAAVAALEALGYEHLGEFGIPGRAYARRGFPRSHNLHAFEPGHPEVDRHLRFRDRLRARPEEAAAYAELKLGLAERLRHDRAAYTEAKSAFIAEVVRRASLPT